METSTATPPGRESVALVTLGCARNEVDSEELAGRLSAAGFDLVDDPAAAAAVLVNTCAFVESAKKDSVDTLLAAADLKADAATRAVVAVGCLAERYGDELAGALPEADAVLGFDDYPDIAARVRSVLAGARPPAHRPRDRRTLLPVTPVHRPGSARPDSVPGHAHSAPDLPYGVSPDSGPRPVRRRLGSGPAAPVKLASGCDRRCSFCAIPSFRGAFLSRPPEEVLGEARWLAGQGVRELYLVSENTTSYGKDLGDLRALESLLPRLAAVDGLARIRLSYLQPAELRPSLVDVVAGLPAVADYFDVSFQHASEPVLRRMRRFGDAERFLALLERVRAAAPAAGIRSNFIVGFPGETEADLDMLADFLAAARLDVVGVFGFSAEDGTEAAGLTGRLPVDEVRSRVEWLGRMAEELTAQRAEDRVGEQVEVLVEQASSAGVEGRAACQGPDVDGTTRLLPRPAAVSVGDLVAARVAASTGVDLAARPLSARRS